mmetsp:Transcript_56742/g.63435  ORF Transcript_56742/g.63435 Transcript_56742/m.63435 type:complete len:98 (+) Transcript_56742:826-1119(+)
MNKSTRIESNYKQPIDGCDQLVFFNFLLPISLTSSLNLSLVAPTCRIGSATDTSPTTIIFIHTYLSVSVAGRQENNTQNGSYIAIEQKRSIIVTENK